MGNMTREELLARLPDYVERTWRDLRWEDERVPEQGMDHAVMILEGVTSTEWELEDMVPESVVVRVPLTPEYREQAMLESSLIAQLFRGTKVRVPEIVRQAYARGTFQSENPVILTLQTELKGELLTAELWQRLTPIEHERIAEQLGSLMATMHAMDPDVLPVSRVEPWWTDAGTRELSTHPRTLPGKLAALRREVAGLRREAAGQARPRLSASQAERIESALSGVDALLARPRQQRAFTHGDLFSAHLLWAPMFKDPRFEFGDLFDGDREEDLGAWAGGVGGAGSAARAGGAVRGDWEQRAASSGALDDFWIRSAGHEPEDGMGVYEEVPRVTRVTEDRLGGGLGVLDFSDMSVGDPAVDYMHLAEIHADLPEWVLQQALAHHDVGPHRHTPLYWKPVEQLETEMAAAGRAGEPIADDVYVLASGREVVRDRKMLERSAVYKRWDEAFLAVAALREGRDPEGLV